MYPPRMHKKHRYQTKNWPAYNQSLIKRGSLTVWVEESTLSGWKTSVKTGKVGAPKVWSDHVIQCCLTVRAVYRLPLRAAQGLMESILYLMRVDAKVPHYSTLSRRSQTIAVRIPRSGEDIAHLVVDSTGLKVYGEGEWKVKKHGSEHRRIWRKIHLGIDSETHEIVAVEVTDNRHSDGHMLPELLEQIDSTLHQVSGDGAYDTKACHQAVLDKKAKATIPPREGAKPWKPQPNGEPHPRTEILETIKSRGKRYWKQSSGYHRRSLSETAMFRIKQIFGDRLASRLFDAQVAEAQIRCAVLNKMVRIGMPETQAIPK